MLHTNSSINQPLGAALSNYAIDVYNYVIKCITEIPRNILKSVTRQQQRPRTHAPQEEAAVGTFLTRCAHLDEITQGVAALSPPGNPTS